MEQFSSPIQTSIQKLKYQALVFSISLNALAYSNLHLNPVIPKSFKWTIQVHFYPVPSNALVKSNLHLNPVIPNSFK